MRTRTAGDVPVRLERLRGRFGEENVSPISPRLVKRENLLGEFFVKKAA